MNRLMQKTGVIELLQRVYDSAALVQLAPLSKSYVPWSGSSIRPNGLVAILNEIVLNNKQCVFECGGGISTIYIARLMKENGGILRTVEHDEKWVSILSSILEKEGLSNTAKVIFAPLSKDESQAEWYSKSHIVPHIEREIDLLFVDGPPAYEREKRLARLPATPFFQPYLAERFSIILDDVDRDGEKEIIKEWEKVLGIRFSSYPIKRGIAIGRNFTGQTV